MKRWVVKWAVANTGGVEERATVEAETWEEAWRWGDEWARGAARQVAWVVVSVSDGTDYHESVIQVRPLSSAERRASARRLARIPVRQVT